MSDTKCYYAARIEGDGGDTVIDNEQVVLWADYIDMEYQRDQLRHQNAGLLGQLDAVVFAHNVMQSRCDRLRDLLREIRELSTELPDSHTHNMVVALVDDELQEAGDE